MFKQSLSRNQRSRGSRVKHVLQVCLLVTVCAWLMYQVKHSHDNKRTMEEILEKRNTEVLRFGRKDLPHVLETDKKTETLKDDEVNEEVEEEESDPEPEHLLTEENEEGDDARVAGEHGTDENDPEEADEEVGNGEELENEENYAQKDSDSNEARLLNNLEEDPVADNQEAREEEYSADDASSAVVRHDDITTESESMSSSEEIPIDTLEMDAEIGNNAVGTGEVISEVTQLNASLEQEEIQKVNNSSKTETSLRLPEHESDSLLYSTTSESRNQLEQEYNSTLDLVNDNIPLRNSSVISNLVHNLESTKGNETAWEDDDSNAEEDSDSIKEKENSDATDRTEDDYNLPEGDLQHETDWIDEKLKSYTINRAEEEDENMDPLV